jgi:hypothetical protein
MQTPPEDQEADLFGRQLQVSDRTLEKAKELLKILKNNPEIEVGFV